MRPITIGSARRCSPGSVRVPRLNQVPVRPPLPGAAPVWRTTSDFDIDYHVQYTRLREPAGMRQLLDYASHLAMRPFDPARPLWESHIVEGLADGRAAAIQKIHHSLGDGIGLLDIALTFLDLERDPPVQPTEPHEPAEDAASALELLTARVCARTPVRSRTSSDRRLPRRSVPDVTRSTRSRRSPASRRSLAASLHRAAVR